MIIAYLAEGFKDISLHFRGMAACLGVMVARLSGVLGVNLLGSFVMTRCTLTFYATAVILLGK